MVRFKNIITNSKALLRIEVFRIIENRDRGGHKSLKMQMRRNKRGGGGGKRGVQPLLHVPWVSFWQGQHHHQPFPRLTAKHIRAAYCSPVVHTNPPSFAWDYSPQLFLYNTDKVSKTNWAFTENSKKVKTEPEVPPAVTFLGPILIKKTL